MKKPASIAAEHLPSPRLLAAARMLVGLTQGELAEEAQVATSTLARYESGAAQLRSDSFSRLLGALRARGIRFVDPTKDVQMGILLLTGDRQA